MENKMKIIGGVGVLLLLGAVVFVWATLPAAKPAPEPIVAVPPQPVTSTYSTTTYAVVYPQEFSLNESYVNDTVNPKKPIYGVKLTIPTTMATGTNLAFDTGVSIEQLPRAKNCTGDIYLAADVKPTTVVENGVNYSVASSSQASAGNVYEEIVYAFTESSPCTALRYFIHSTAVGSYDPGVVHEYNRAGLMEALDSIRKAVRIGAPAPEPTPALNPAATPTP